LAPADRFAVQILGLRNPKDLWCLGFMVAYPALIGFHWLRGPDFLLIALSCLAAYSMGCVQHCHGHMPFFRHRFGNRLVEFLFTLYRVDGCYAWKATHNANHHRFANRVGDYTLTWSTSSANNLTGFLTYLAFGTFAYIRASLAYLAISLWRGSFLGGFWLAQLAAYTSILIFLLFRDIQTTIAAVILPQVFGLLAMIGTGYFQHHHADEEHPYDNSRNFTGGLLNRLTFNHGYHLVHHLHVNMHWSEWPDEHARLNHRIHPDLNQKSLIFYLLKIFLLQHFDSRYATRNFRAARVDPAALVIRTRKARTSNLIEA
jgi:beta-carotene hydroxylase